MHIKKNTSKTTLRNRVRILLWVLGTSGLKRLGYPHICQKSQFETHDFEVKQMRNPTALNFVFCLRIKKEG